MGSGNSKLEFDLKENRLLSISYRDKILLDTPLDINLWRAATDNDGIRGWSGQDEKPMGQWMNAGLDRLKLKSSSSSINEIGKLTTITVNKIWIGSDKELEIHHRQIISFEEENRIKFHNNIHINKGFPTLPRVGIKFELLPGFENLSWYGKGPLENYIDRDAGSPVGYYESTVTDQFVPYILPQENGNKSSVRRFELNNGYKSIQIKGDKHIEFSVSHFSADELFNKRYTNELVP